MTKTEAAYSFGETITVAAAVADSDTIDFREFRDIAICAKTGTGTCDIFASHEDVDASFFDTGIDIIFTSTDIWVAADERLFPCHFLRIVDSSVTVIDWMGKG